jgi:tetraacyldisaccharide 4'-kinase
MKEYFYNLITGERRVFIGPILRPFLLLAASLFFVIVKTRFFLYKTGILMSGRLPVPVISVGNITWGGTGKTPLVEALIKRLHHKGLSLVLLTRGYGNDEDKVISSNMPYARVLAGKRRLFNALDYSRGNKADAFVLDDGFQHLKIKRDIDIVTINAQGPFGNNMLFPAGCLREPVNALRRAHIVVITKSDLVPAQKLIELTASIRNISNDIMIVRARHKPKFLFTANGQERPLEYIKGKRVLAVSALADNPSFIKTVENLGAEIAFSLSYIDHHRYREDDVRVITESFKAFRAGMVVTTEKDWVKLSALVQGPAGIGIEFTILKIELEVEEDEAFYRRVYSVLPG